MKSKLVLPILALSICVLPGLTCPSDCGETEPNPAVDRIDFTLVSGGGTMGDVRIDGVVENKGGGTFDSSAGKQSVQLLEGSGINFTVVATQDFEDLAPGETVTVSFTKVGWSTVNEFPPDYRVFIVYDPDISMDGNDNNDDCATSDNTLERSGSEINDLF